MLLAYFDESGDSGYVGSPSNAFALAAVIVHEEHWLECLNGLGLVRRVLREKWGISPRQEVKANYLVQGRGAFRMLPLPVRGRIYRGFLALQPKLQHVRTFAVVVRKELVLKKELSPRDMAWEFAIQRLQRLASAENEHVHLFPDEGHGSFIRHKLRAMRRFSRVPSRYGEQGLDRPVANIIEDPSDRQSHESFFVQLADVNAYAAYRRCYPHRDFGADCWEELGSARIEEVNAHSGGPTGIFVWPYK